MATQRHTFVERIAHSDQETSNTLDKNEHLDEGIQPIYSPPPPPKGAGLMGKRKHGDPTSSGRELETKRPDSPLVLFQNQMCHLDAV